MGQLLAFPRHRRVRPTAVLRAEDYDGLMMRALQAAIAAERGAPVRAAELRAFAALAADPRRTRGIWAFDAAAHLGTMARCLARAGADGLAAELAGTAEAITGRRRAELAAGA